MGKEVLIITYYWPPAGGPGVQRMLKFARYLKEFGWNPVILTTSNGTFPSRDETLLHDVPEGIPVYTSRTIEPFTLYNKLKGVKSKEMSTGLIGLQHPSRLQRFSNYIRANYFIPDARKGWNITALKKAHKIINNHRIKAIITTGPPHSTHLIGRKLKSTYGLPWIADFRDPWTSVFYNHYFPRTNSTKAKDLKLESAVLKEADAVTVISNGLKREYISRAKETVVLYNGFDKNDLKPRVNQKSEKFTLHYIGSFKPNQNVPALWEAIAELKKEGNINEHNFEVRLTGKLDPGVNNELKTSAISPLIKTEGYVPHHMATQKMQQSALLLFIIPQEKDNHLIITGKLFEYMASLTPLLPIGPTGGDAAKIIRSSGRGEMADYEDKETLKRYISYYIAYWKEHDQVPYHHAFDDKLQQYSRKQLTQSLATLLDQITDRSHAY